MTLPDRLSAALSSRQPTAVALEHRSEGRKVVQRGDIRRVEPCFEPEGAVRLALVLDVDSDENSVEIVLVHPYAELATEADLVFSPDETGMPYPVVVQTRVRSAVWTLQMRERVGRLSEEALKEFGQVTVADDPFAASPRTGPPLAGPADSRWAFKRLEIKTLNSLAADRISAVFEDGLNPRWLSLVPTSQDSYASPLVRELTARPSEWSMDDLEALSEVDALNHDTWTKQFGRDLGRDFHNSYQSSIDKVLTHAA